ncbi:hypothetical protein D3C80_1143210 [compost metagenome]
MRLGAGEGGLVLIALDRVEHGLGFTQLAPLSQATGIEDQRTGIAVVFREQCLEGALGFAEAPFGEQCLGQFQRVGGSGWRQFYVGFEQGANRRLRLGTGKAVHGLTILEQHHGRQAADAEAGNDVLLDIAVDLGQQQFALVTLGDLRQQRHQRLARRAPLGPEIHQHRFVVGVGDYQLIEIGSAGIENIGCVLAHRDSRKSVNGITIKAGGWRGTG